MNAQPAQVSGMHARWLGLCVLWALLALGLLATPAASATGQREVFVLHSYSHEYPWTKRQHQGFLHGLERDTTHAYSVRTEALDTKRLPYDAAHARLMAEQLAAKYAGYTPDAVYVTDDDALSFALEHLGRIFPAAPVVFSGVNDLGVKPRLDRSRMTGVFERKQLAPNLELLRQLVPGVQHIVVLGDASETYRAIVQDLRHDLARFPAMQARFVADRRIDTVLAALRAGPETVVILTTLGGLVDSTGATLMPGEGIARIVALRSHTVLSMEDVYLVGGVLGGYVTSGTAQGEAAAAMLVRHFGGTAMAAIPPLEDSPNEYLFDGRELARAGLSLPGTIAERATILHPPPGWYQRHQREIVAALMSLAAACALLLLAGRAVLRKNRLIDAKARLLGQRAARLTRVQDDLLRAQRMAAIGNWEWAVAEDRLVGSEEVSRILHLPHGQPAAGFQAFLARVHPADRATVAEFVRKALDAGAAWNLNFRTELPGGDIREVRANAEVLRDENGQAVRMLGTLEDVTERERSTRALLASEEKLRKVIESLPVVLWMIDAQGRFLLSEGLGLKGMGLRPGQVVGQSLFELYAEVPEIVADTHRVLAGHTLTSTRQIGASSFELRYSPLHDASGSITGAIGVAIDVTENKQYESRLAFLANYDPVTSLPNRFLFRDRLGRALRSADRQGQRVALLFVDLDNFKNINDSLGHAAGDQLLKLVAARLQGVVSHTDTVSRLGGDEFTLILEGRGHDDDTRQIAARIVEQSAQPYDIEGREVYVTASVGIAIYPQDGDNEDMLLMNADAAMYRAKDNGRNGFEFFTSEINARAMQRLELGSELRGALGHAEFSLHFQPKADLADGRVIGFEALLRWRNARLGSVSPAVFVPILEELGLIIEVGEWVLREACRWAAGLPAGTGAPAVVSVNLSARQFRQPQLVQVVEQALLDTGLPASRLELEITESSLVDLQANLQTMNQLKVLGVALSIDDFGTGYSSLSYLKRFPVDRLKVDASFVRDVAVDVDDAAIVKAIIGLGRHLELRVIAEGVETEEQQDFLRRHGCDEMQGYLLARPMPALQAAAWLQDRAAQAPQPTQQQPRAETPLPG